MSVRLEDLEVRDACPSSYERQRQHGDLEVAATVDQATSIDEARHVGGSVRSRPARTSPAGRASERPSRGRCPRRHPGPRAHPTRPAGDRRTADPGRRARASASQSCALVRRDVAVDELARSRSAGRVRSCSKWASAAASVSNQSLRATRPSDDIETSATSYCIGPPPADGVSVAGDTQMRDDAVVVAGQHLEAELRVGHERDRRARQLHGSRRPVQHVPAQRPVVDPLVVRRPKLEERVPVARRRESADADEEALRLGCRADLLEALERGLRPSAPSKISNCVTRPSVVRALSASELDLEVAAAVDQPTAVHVAVERRARARSRASSPAVTRTPWASATRPAHDLDEGVAALELAPADQAVVDEPQVRRVDVAQAVPVAARCWRRRSGRRARAGVAGASPRRSSSYRASAAASSSGSKTSDPASRPSRVRLTRITPYSICAATVSGVTTTGEAVDEPLLVAGDHLDGHRDVRNELDPGAEQRHRRLGAAHRLPREHPAVGHDEVVAVDRAQCVPVARADQAARTCRQSLGRRLRADLLEALERGDRVRRPRRSRSTSRARREKIVSTTVSISKSPPPSIETAARQRRASRLAARPTASSSLVTRRSSVRAARPRMTST